MIEIDGSYGEGGGQILRTAVTVGEGRRFGIQAPGHGVVVIGLKASICQIQCLFQLSLPQRQPRLKQQYSRFIRIPFPEALQFLLGFFDQTNLKKSLDLKKMILQVVLEK